MSVQPLLEEIQRPAMTMKSENESYEVKAALVCCTRGDCPSQSRFRSNSDLSAVSHASSCGECDEQDFCPDCTTCVDEPSCAVSSTVDWCQCKCPADEEASEPGPAGSAASSTTRHLPSTATDKNSNSFLGNMSRGRKLQLWEFLFNLLSTQENCASLQWVDEAKGIFQIISPQLLASQWGSHRNRKSMTYDKLSRTMRYYYSKSIITKVPNMNRTYKFHYDIMSDLRHKTF